MHPVFMQRMAAEHVKAMTEVADKTLLARQARRTRIRKGIDRTSRRIPDQAGPPCPGRGGDEMGAGRRPPGHPRRDCVRRAAGPGGESGGGMTALRVAVAGGSGLVGRHVVGALQRRGHEAVVLARGRGVDLETGDGLAQALCGVAAVVDATNTSAAGPDEARAFFGAVTGNLLAAEQQAGVRHHVVLSIVGVDRVEGNGQDLVDMARRMLAARGERLRLVPTWQGPFGTEMAGEVLLPGPGAVVAPTTFEQWLGAQRPTATAS